MTLPNSLSLFLLLLLPSLPLPLPSLPISNRRRRSSSVKGSRISLSYLYPLRQGSHFGPTTLGSSRATRSVQNYPSRLADASSDQVGEKQPLKFPVTRSTESAVGLLAERERGASEKTRGWGERGEIKSSRVRGKDRKRRRRASGERYPADEPAMKPRRTRCLFLQSMEGYIHGLMAVYHARLLRSLSCVLAAHTGGTERG